MKIANDYLVKKDDSISRTQSKANSGSSTNLQGEFRVMKAILQVLHLLCKFTAMLTRIYNEIELISGIFYS